MAAVRSSVWISTAILAAIMSAGSGTGNAQGLPGRSPGGVRMTETLLSQSVAGLVEDGWQIKGVSQAGPAFAYHLVHENSLAICYFNIAEQPPNSLCYRMAPLR